MVNPGLPKNYLPSRIEVERYVELWQKTPKYQEPEKGLDRLFGVLCPMNEDIEGIILKCASLNNIYNTNIYDIHSMARHILELHIDERLTRTDLTLVNDIANVEIGGKHRFFYSFATKYCSRHRPLSYAIYDSYVEKVLAEIQSRDHFSAFTVLDLRNYSTFMKVVYDFQKCYGLEQCSLKQLDQYLWQLGKKYYSQY